MNTHTSPPPHTPYTLDTHFLPITPSRILGPVKGSISTRLQEGSVTGEWDVYKGLGVGPKTFPYENVSPQVSGGMSPYLYRRVWFLLWISSVSMLPHPKPQVCAWPGLFSHTHPAPSGARSCPAPVGDSGALKGEGGYWAGMTSGSGAQEVALLPQVPTA